MEKSGIQKGEGTGYGVVKGEKKTRSLIVEESLYPDDGRRRRQSSEYSIGNQFVDCQRDERH